MLRELFFPFLEEFISFLVGLFFFRKLNMGLKFFVFQLAISCLTEVLIFTRVAINVNLAYWYYLIFDFGFLFWAAYFFSSNKRLNPYFYWGTVFFLIVWISDFLNVKSNRMALHTYEADFILLIIAYLMVLYEEAMTNINPIYKSPIFWLCTNIIIFYGCIFCYFSLANIEMKYLTKEQIKFLSFFVLKILVVLRYFIISYSFFLYCWNQKLSRQQINNAKK